MSTAVHLPQPEDLQPGQLIDGRYRVEARLAHGGMASVYRAWDSRLDRPVALKVIDAELAKRPEYVERFIREAKSTARLSHPNVVGVYDQSVLNAGDRRAPTLAYLAMEYVPGSTLRQLLGRRGRLTPRQAMQVLDAMLAGLGAAHRAGIVHRDVKPENVLINDSALAQNHSYAAALKVSDFGLARSVSGGQDGTLGGSLPGGGLIGTASYLAPELVRTGSCDQRSDVYSAGIVLYELLTGRKPFAAATPVQVAQMHVTNRVPAPSALLPGLDPAIDALVARATAREPEHRPDDANALRGELRAAYAALPDAALDLDGSAVRSEATQALRPDHATRPDVAPTRMDLSGNIGSNGRGSATKLAVSPLPPVAPRRRPDEPYRYAPEDGARRRYRGLIIFLVIVVVAVTVGVGAWLYGSTHYQSMPDLTGLSKSAAERALDNDGLKWKVTEVPSQSVAAGEVASTSPASGRPVADGATVTLDVSSGPAQIAVPDVTGLSQSDATGKLDSLGFTVTVASQTQSSNVPSGDVAAYSPTGTATQGSTITLVLSGGPQQAVVPDVTGMNIDDATAKLKGLGFQVVSHHVSMMLKTVLHQSPDGGQSTDQGGTVTLYY